MVPIERIYTYLGYHRILRAVLRPNTAIRANPGSICMYTTLFIVAEYLLLARIVRKLIFSNSGHTVYLAENFMAVS